MCACVPAGMFMSLCCTRRLDRCYCCLRTGLGDQAACTWERAGGEARHTYMCGGVPAFSSPMIPKSGQGVLELCACVFVRARTCVCVSWTQQQ